MWASFGNFHPASFLYYEAWKTIEFEKSCDATEMLTYPETETVK